MNQYAEEMGSSGPRAIFTLVYQQTVNSKPIHITVDGEVMNKEGDVLTIRYWHPITGSIETRNIQTRW